MLKYFRRRSFPTMDDQQPKWHLLATAQHGHFTALCGYTHHFVLEDPMYRAQVKTTSRRCAKCDAKEKENLDDHH